MKALVIAPQPFFSPRGTPFSVYYRTRVCAEQGWDIDLVTYGEGVDPDIPGVRIWRGPKFMWLGPVSIGPSFKKLVLDFFMFWRVLWMLITRRYGVVHAHEEAVFFCVMLRPIFRFKLVYDMHSSLPQQLSNFKFTTSTLIHGIFKWFEDKAIARAAAVITICPDLRDYVLKAIPDPHRHFLIENSIYEPVKLKDRAESQQEAVPPLELPEGVRLLVYAGTLESYQGIDILVRSMPEVLAEQPDAFLLIVGGTQEQVDEYRRLAETWGCAERLKVVPCVPQHVARAWLSRAEVQLSPRSAGTNTPLKTYEQLNNGIPLVATRIYSHTQVLTDEVCYLAEPEPKCFARAILKAMTDGAADNPKVTAAKALYAEKYSRPAYEGKLRKMMELL